MYAGHFPPLGHAEMVRRPPFTFVDEHGRELSIRTYGAAPVDDEFEALVAMYQLFDPAFRSLGIPPTDEAAIRRWLEQITDDVCVLAWDGDRVVGHAVLVDDGESAHELAIFVDPDYHGAGVGTRLVEGLLTEGRERGVDHVWLLVERANRPAVNLYRDVGFAVADDTGYDLEMALAM